METIDASGVSDQEKTEAWNRIVFSDKLVTHTGGEAAESLNNTRGRRRQAALDGEWLDLKRAVR